MKRKYVACIIASLLMAIPVFAVFNEKNLGQTLSVLRFELQEQNDRMESSREKLKSMNESQRSEMRKMMKKSNELALILYSQNQDFTFDMTYALKQVMEKSEDFDHKRMPYDRILANLDIEIDRYERLTEALRRLPPAREVIEDIPDSLYLSKDGTIFGLRYTKYLKHNQIDSQKVSGEQANTQDREHGENASEGKSNMIVNLLTGNGFGQADVRAAGISEEIYKKVMDASEEKNTVYLLNEEQMEDRDSCMTYSLNLLRMYKSAREDLIRNATHYNDMKERLDENYGYALKRYRQIQKRIFIEGQDNYLTILKSFPKYTAWAFSEAKTKYSAVELHHTEGHEHNHSHSEWRGPVVSGLIIFVLLYIIIATVLSTLIMTVITRTSSKAQSEHFKLRRPCISILCGVLVFAVSVMVAGKYVRHNFISSASSLLLLFCWLMTAILASTLIRTEPRQLKMTLRSYLPVVLMGLMVVVFRIIFIPNRLVNLIFPPLLLAFTIWQWWIYRKEKKELQRGDKAYALLTSIVLAVSTAMALTGYVLLSVQVLMWWLFQIAALSTVTAIKVLLDKYEDKVLKKNFVRYKSEHKGISDKGEGAYIEVSWFYDLIRMAVMPAIAVLTVPASIWLASGVFDLTAVCKDLFFRPFFNLTDADGNAILHLSIFRLVLVVCLFYVFRYIAYAMRSFYKHYKLQKLMSDTGKEYVRSNEVNLTLVNNIIAIAVWGGYAIMAIKVLKIPMKSVTMVLTGLSAGIGLALKDVLNNFIYGIQLMSGRLRVGDYIECDGIRGKVESITYQSTQIETLDGAIMAITNTTLFNKNFKNLTRNNSYECVRIPVGVSYGADVGKVRDILTESLKQLDIKDKYGRNIIDQKRGITVVFNDFGDSSINLVVKQFVLVEEELAYIAKAKEIIYNSLNENGVEIPFPQRDIYIRKIEKGDGN